VVIAIIAILMALLLPAHSAELEVKSREGDQDSTSTRSSTLK
jgi:hypothetical protein